MARLANRPDFVLTNHGSICLLRPITTAAKAWAEEHIEGDVAFDGAIVVEPRYVDNLLQGIGGAGMVVS